MWNGFVLVIAGLFSLWTSAVAAMPMVQLTLRTEVTLDALSFSLGDVAVIQAEDPELLNVLGHIPLGQLLRAGDVVHLSRAGIQRAVQTNLPLQQQVQLQWAGASMVRVGSRRYLHTNAAMLDVAAQELVRALQGQDSVIQLKPMTAVSTLSLPKGEVSYRVLIAAMSRPAAAHVTVPVEVRVGGALMQTLPVTFEVQHQRPVLVARTFLDKGRLLQCGDVDIQVREVASMALPPVIAQCDAKLRLRRSVVAGEVLTPAQLESLPLISKGDSVVLQVAAGNVRLQAQALALADGEFGQHIQVLPSHAQGVVRATVRGAGQVVLDEN